MSNVSVYKELTAFHPGYYVSDIIDDLGITQAEFATRLGTNTKTLSCLINGQANISNDLAKKLSVMLGTSEEVWLNLQAAYDQKLIEIQKASDLDEQKYLARLIDYKFFVDVAGLNETRDVKEKIQNLCSYFKVSDLRILMIPDFLVNFRTGVNSVSEKNIINSKAWVQTAINCSSIIDTKDYDEKKLKSFLPQIREMTVQKPEVFLPKIKKIFSECGVAFVLLPNLRNSGVNGAVKWVSDKRVVLAMNNRGLDADIFWFSLFHEIKHVFQKKTKTMFVSFDEDEMNAVNKSMEDEADGFARNYLIPQADFKKLAPTKYITDKEILGFAKKIGVHPGIVVGRLQHDGILQPNRAAKFKEKYNIVSIS